MKILYYGFSENARTDVICEIDFEYIEASIGEEEPALYFYDDNEMVDCWVFNEATNQYRVLKELFSRLSKGERFFDKLELEKMAHNS